MAGPAGVGEGALLVSGERVAAWYILIFAVDSQVETCRNVPWYGHDTGRDGVWIGGEGVYMVSGAELMTARSAYDEVTSLLSKGEGRIFSGCPSISTPRPRW
jgi:hypothetical protein